MGKVERRVEALLDLLRSGGKIDVGTIQRKLNVSDVTVRRLLMRLEAEGKIIRTHGGARPIDTSPYSFLREEARAQREKSLLGVAAADIVESGNRIFLDSGTTIMSMAESLVSRIRTGGLSNLLVLTHSLSLFEIIGSYAKMIITGGEARPARCDVCGAVAERTLAEYHVDKAFFGADGIHPSHGLMCADEHSCRINQTVMARAGKTYVLADSGKFNHTSLMTYAPLDAVDLVLTDGGITPGLLTLFRVKGLVVDVVGEVHPETQQ